MKPTSLISPLSGTLGLVLALSLGVDPKQQFRAAVSLAVATDMAGAAHSGRARRLSFFAGSA